MELFHGGMGQNIATSTVVEVAILRGLEAAKEMVLVRVEALEQGDHVGPVDVGVGVDVNIPVILGALLERHIRLAHVLVLIEVPGFPTGVAKLLAVLLVDETVLLAAVDVEVAVSILDAFDGVAEDVVDTVPHDVFLHVGKDEEVGQASRQGLEEDRQAVVGLARTRLDDEEEVRDVGEVFAGGIDGTGGKPVVPREDALGVGLGVGREVRRGLFVLAWLGCGHRRGLRVRRVRRRRWRWRMRRLGGVVRGQGEARGRQMVQAIVEIGHEDEDGEDEGDAHDGDGGEVHLADQHGGECSLAADARERPDEGADTVCERAEEEVEVEAEDLDQGKGEDDGSKGEEKAATAVGWCTALWLAGRVCPFLGVESNDGKSKLRPRLRAPPDCLGVRHGALFVASCPSLHLGLSSFQPISLPLSLCAKILLQLLAGTRLFFPALARAATDGNSTTCTHRTRSAL